ncbi:zinc-binding oxidoreductase [Aspergillus steynii IBT 23096]|uniref:Zinc-binding oxidoreductase n=1 Tax=Aspergillus steynii IBT 23096 TaxID=1392250 RepID=A0A2I2G842_9EURO|nr:zinc-binding oxidoreductase [Aspergillus steynii IBT 23096]PLB49034.1 zinc-binding oxidoreductase [Aspergillus steynii IBT 23096]
MTSNTPGSLPETMKAWTFSQSGPPQSTLQLQHIPLPTLSTDTSLLIRVSHVSLHPGTVIMMNLIPSIFRNPSTIAETDFSGVVVSTGKKVPVSRAPNSNRSFPPGTAVFGSIPVPQHLLGSGALAEYVVVDMASVARKPESFTFAEAAGLAVSGSTALDLLDAARLQPEGKVLLNAPCGGIGHFVTQIVADEGAHYIVGVCSGTSADLARDLGCDEVTDYHVLDDGTCLGDSLASRFSGDNAFDAIIDAHGSQHLWHSAPKFLKPGRGHAYTTVGPALGSYTYRAMGDVLKDMVLNKCLPKWMGGVDREYRQVASIVTTEKLERLANLGEAVGMIAYVGGEWAFEDVLQAYEVLISKHAKGKLAIRVWEPSFAELNALAGRSS